MGPVRRRILVTGVVQGVGFRPFVFREASGLGLSGFVRNTPGGVEIEAEGPEPEVSALVEALRLRPPNRALVRGVETEERPPAGGGEFAILDSGGGGSADTLVSPDIAVCADCLAELFDPPDRRHRYPFINCTNCGPRFTIVSGVPYDRARTTMSAFRMCPDCEREYRDPADRRFHAQPNACPACGPRLRLADPSGRDLAAADPVREAAALLRGGGVVAVKGLGGFHLACNAADEGAVKRLRLRKGREEKPLAVMAAGLPAVLRFARPTGAERAALESWRRPIVLVPKALPFPLAESTAPGNRFIGVLLPYTPLHHLLLAEGFEALVMTSANVSEDPIVFENDEAFRRLAGMADAFLAHDRGIHVRNDDTVLRFAAGGPCLVRRSRGYAPHPVFLAGPLPAVLAAGGEMKNTLCLIRGDKAFPSQHVGDLENPETLESFERAADHLCRLLETEPVALAHDMHPDYLSTQWAAARGLPRHAVQHHHAHIVSCLAENGRADKVIGIALDGTGYGTDGTVWGGEILVADLRAFTRAGRFGVRSMPGGPAAVKAPWRMAVSYLEAALSAEAGGPVGEPAFLERVSGLRLSRDAGMEKVRSVFRLLRSGIRQPATSSLGRLFDGMSALAGIRSISSYEGQAAFDLEMALEEADSLEKSHYSFNIKDIDGMIEIGFDSVILETLKDAVSGRSGNTISRKFHSGLVPCLAEAAEKVREKTGIGTVALSGGCFQNRFLLENLKNLLESSGFEALVHSQVPANDGGLSLGQAVAAAARMSL